MPHSHQFYQFDRCFAVTTTRKIEHVWTILHPLQDFCQRFFWSQEPDLKLVCDTYSRWRKTYGELWWSVGFIMNVYVSKFALRWIFLFVIPLNKERNNKRSETIISDNMTWGKLVIKCPRKLSEVGLSQISLGLREHLIIHFLTCHSICL